MSEKGSVNKMCERVRMTMKNLLNRDTCTMLHADCHLSWSNILSRCRTTNGPHPKHEVSIDTRTYFVFDSCGVFGIGWPISVFNS